MQASYFGRFFFLFTEAVRISFSELDYCSSENEICNTPVYFFPFIVLCPNMHVTSMDLVDRRTGENEVMYASVRRERQVHREAGRT